MYFTKSDAAIFHSFNKAVFVYHVDKLRCTIEIVLLLVILTYLIDLVCIQISVH